MEYLILFAIILYPVIRYDFGSQKDNNNTYLFFEGIAVVALMGFRYHVGGDSFNYENEYMSYPTLSNIASYKFSDSNYAYLWQIFSIICKTISKDFWVQQLIHSIIVNISFFYFFKKHTRYYFLAIFLYVLLFLFKYNTEVLRSALSVSVFLFSYDYLIEKRFIKYYILSIIAFFIHYQAALFFFLPVVFLFKDARINIKNVFVFLVLIFLVNTSLSIFPALQDFFSFNAVMSHKVEKYGSVVQGQMNVNNIIYHLMVDYSPICILLLLRKDVKDMLNPFIILYLAFGLLSLRWLHLTGRLEDPLIPILIVAFVNQISIESIRSQKFLSWLALLIFIFLYFTSSTLHLLPLIYPYHSIFDPVDEPGREMLFELMLNNEL